MYKVIADYPFCPYKVGDFVAQSCKTSVYKSFHITTTDYEDWDGKTQKCANWVSEEGIIKYPHLFKKPESNEQL